MRVSQTDDTEDAEVWAHGQVAEGFTVWVYDHGHPARVAGASDYRLIAHYRPAADGRPGTGPARIPRIPRPARPAPPDPAPAPARRRRRPGAVGPPPSAAAPRLIR